MLTANILKIVAIIVMILDHIGSYFVAIIPADIYYVLRSVGRIAMPVFLYLMVQGFFHTKNIKKYIFRIFCLATVTQIILIIMGIVNVAFFPNYVTRQNEYLGILFSYTLSLILISMFEYKIIIKKLNKICNLILRIIIILFIMFVYVNFDIEFDMRIPFMCMELYIIEKIFMDREKKVLFVDRIFNNSVESILSKLVYLFLIALSFVTCLDFSAYHPGYRYAILYSLVPIMLYNGKKGKENKFIRFTYYAVFPIQHCLIYFFAMIVCG